MKKKRKRKQAGRGRRPRSRPRALAADHEDDGPAREKILRGQDNVELPPEEASAAELEGDVRRGRVVSIRAMDIRVEPAEGGEPVATVLRKSTRVPHPKMSAVVVGDDVNYLFGSEPPHVLTAIEPRRSHLTRIRRGRERHVICANVDFGVVVSSAVDPPFKPRLVDRYLLSFAEGGLEPVLALNKVDLLDGEDPAGMLRPYEGLPVHAFAVSATSGEGLEGLQALLSGKTAVFSGQSGVGKSSLLNRLLGLEISTRTVQESTGKGRHTTTNSTFYPFPFGGGVIDTPGVRSFQLATPTADGLESFFPEIFRAAESCRFRDCSHRGDAGCAVRPALEAGKIRSDRLDSFFALIDDLPDE